MTIVTKLSAQWATRPDHERFTSLPEMYDHAKYIESRSGRAKVSRNQIAVEPDGNDLLVIVDGKAAARPTYSAFTHLADAYGRHADYLRTLPAPIAAQCLNHHIRSGSGSDAAISAQKDMFGLSVITDAQAKQYDHSLLLMRPEQDDKADLEPLMLRAVQGPDYGHINNSSVIGLLQDRFGDGVTGDWRVPGEFGVAVAQVTKANTSLFMGEEDLFIGLSDERNKVEIERRGKASPMSRGLLMWNSEVGSRTFGFCLFYFDYACMNRIFWGVENYVEVNMRHSKNAVSRFLSEAVPALTEYLALDTDKSMVRAIEHAKTIPLVIDGNASKRDALLASVVGKRKVPIVLAQHEAEEFRPVETVWDATTALTAHARVLTNPAERYKIERATGDILMKATANIPKDVTVQGATLALPAPRKSKAKAA